MKKSIVFAALALMFVGCAKEAQNDFEKPENNTPATVRTVSLTASVPELTKAAIDDDAAFSWTAGDAIAVPANGIDGGYAIFVNSAETPDVFTYDLKEGETLKDGTAYYPAASATASDYSFSSVAEAGAGFRMEAPFQAGSSDILEFAHKSALTKVTFNNVPGYATGVKVFNEDDALISSVAFADGDKASNITLCIPTPPSSKATYSLVNDDNIIASARTNSAIVAGHYYAAPDINVSTIIANKWSVIGQLNGTNWDTDFWMTQTETGVWEIDIVYTEGTSFKLRKGGDYDIAEAGQPNDQVLPVPGDGGEYKLWELYNKNIQLPMTGTYHLKFVTEGYKFYATREEGIPVYDINELYILGDATDTGWTLGAMQQLEKNGNLFSIDANLTKDLRFRFPLQKIPDPATWWPCLVKGYRDGTVVEGYNDTYDSAHFKVSEDGNYHIVIDAYEMTISITRNGSKKPFSELYVLGPGCEADWSIDAMPKFTAEPDGYNYHIYANLYERDGGEFRFPTTRNWFPSVVKGASKGSIKVLTQSEYEADNSTYTPFNAASDADGSGFYKIDVDANNMRVNFTRLCNNVGGVFGNMYLIGDALSPPWTLNAEANKFERNGQIYTLRTHIGAAPLMFRIEGSDDWFPALMKGDADNSLKVFSADEYDVVKDTVNDPHFTVPVSGTYDITVNLSTLTIAIELVTAD